VTALLKPAEAAAYLNVSLSTLYTYYREWGVPAYMVGKHLRFKASDLELWLDGQRVK
jgi:excisionase family DNA binding protein